MLGMILLHLQRKFDLTRRGSFEKTELYDQPTNNRATHSIMLSNNARYNAQYNRWYNARCNARCNAWCNTFKCTVSCTV